jgi:hypothetical protein
VCTRAQIAHSRPFPLHCGAPFIASAKKTQHQYQQQQQHPPLTLTHTKKHNRKTKRKTHTFFNIIKTSLTKKKERKKGHRRVAVRRQRHGIKGRQRQGQWQRRR